MQCTIHVHNCGRYHRSLIALQEQIVRVGVEISVSIRSVEVAAVAMHAVAKARQSTTKLAGKSEVRNMIAWNSFCSSGISMTKPTGGTKKVTMICIAVHSSSPKLNVSAIEAIRAQGTQRIGTGAQVGVQATAMGGLCRGA